MADPALPVRRPRVADHRTHWAVLAAFAGLVVVAGFSAVAFSRSLGLEAQERLVENEAIARSVAGLIEARQQGHLNALLAYAGRFRFREAIERRDRAEALVHLRQLHETFPGIDRAFLTDPAGVLWAVYPDVPGVLGRSFAHRDWYQGVSREWGPYMGEVTRGASPGQPLAVVLVVPVRQVDGRVIGIIGSGQRLDVIREWLLPITVPGGDLYVVDRKGQLVFHPTRTGPERLADYAQVPVVQRLLRGEEGAAELENPVEREVRLQAYRRLPSLGWGVVVQRSKNLALQGTRTLMLVSAVAGFLLAGALAILGAVALRNQRETAAALVALEGKAGALAASEMRLRSVTQSAADAIVSADTRGRIVSWNSGAEASFGYREDEVLGQPLTLLMPERYRAAYEKGLERVRLTGESHLVGRTIELHGLRKDGAEFPVELSLSTWRSGDENFYTGIIRDVTERQRAQAALREAQEALARKERLAILGQLAGGVSHELRNPLGVIKNSVYYLRMVHPEDDRVRKHLGILEREVATANRIVTDLLDFARMRAPTRVLTDLNSVVRDVLERNPVPPSIRVQLELEADLSPVSADPDQVGQVVGNLVTNAVQAMPDGGTLTVATVAAEGAVSLSVADTGVGIAPEHVEKIFQPLFTTKARGIGLGLAVASRLAAANEATISVESAPGRGSRFMLRFAPAGGGA